MASDEFEDGDLVNRAGQSILRLLDGAADAADENSRQAVEMAQSLAQQLRAARERMLDWRIILRLIAIAPSLGSTRSERK